MSVIRVGSRESRLAVIQSELVMEAIRAACPGAELELVTMKTTGDKILDRTLDQVGGKGLFVKELDAALLESRVDLTVHSLKDLPMEPHPGLPVAAYPRRADPRDVLVLPEGETEWDRSRPVGCASLRRKLQLEALFPGVEVRPVRGNVLTRLNKLDRGEYGALVLAAAGLERLGLAGRIARYFSVEELLPAAGQGILAVQVRAGRTTPGFPPSTTRRPRPAPGPSGLLSGRWTEGAPPRWRPTPCWREKRCASPEWTKRAGRRPSGGPGGRRRRWGRPWPGR